MGRELCAGKFSATITDLDQMAPFHPGLPYEPDGIWPDFPPDGWRILDPWGDGWRLLGPHGLRVVIDASTKTDGLPWLHVSVSRKGWVPTWDDLKFVQAAFAPNRDAVIVLPREAEYVNLHPFCHHLWIPIGHKPLPDFAGTISGVKTI